MFIDIQSSLMQQDQGIFFFHPCHVDGRYLFHLSNYNKIACLALTWAKNFEIALYKLIMYVFLFVLFLFSDIFLQYTVQQSLFAGCTDR